MFIMICWADTVFILFLFFLPIFTDKFIPNRNTNTNQKHYC